MTARMLTGLLLIVAPIVTLIGFMGLGVAIENLDFGDTLGTIASFGENPTTVKVLMSIGTLGLLMSVLGFAGLSDSMAGGSGSHYTKIGLILYSIGLIIVVGESAMYIATADAASQGAQAALGARRGWCRHRGRRPRGRPTLSSCWRSRGARRARGSRRPLLETRSRGSTPHRSRTRRTA